MIVQIVSSCCASSIVREDILLKIKFTPKITTKTKIPINNTNAWSWKSIISSWIGVAGSIKLICPKILKLTKDKKPY